MEIEEITALVTFQNLNVATIKATTAIKDLIFGILWRQTPGYAMKQRLPLR